MYCDKDKGQWIDMTNRHEYVNGRHTGMHALEGVKHFIYSDVLISKIVNTVAVQSILFS